MNGIIYTFLITLLGCINLDFYLLKSKPKEFVKGAIRRLYFGVIVAFVLAYVYMPATIFPDILVPLGLMLAINCMYTIATHMHAIMQNNLKKISIPLNILTILLLILAVGPSLSLLQAEKLSEIPNVKILTEQISQINEDQIMQVPYGSAKILVEKAVKDLKIGQSVSSLNLQLIKDHLYFVAPLESNNFLNSAESYGYVIVDAQNSEVNATVVEKKEMKYMLNSNFQYNLYRTVYLKYPDHRFSQISFEIDDLGTPYWILGAFEPTIWSTGDKLVGAVIVDPVSGKSSFYSKDKIPKWVDQVFPSEIAEEYNYWYGRYQHGFFNTIFSSKVMNLPSTKFGHYDLGLVRTDTGLVWLTGITNSSSKNQSLIGYTTINTRSGEMIYYSNASGIYDEQSVLSLAGSTVSNFLEYINSPPLLYNLYGELTFVVPFNSDSSVQKNVIVNAESGKVFSEDSFQKTLESYKRWIYGSTNLISNWSEFETVQGTVDRINGEYIVLRKGTRILSHIFKLSGDEAKITREGDRVAIKYRISNETEVDVIEFDNLEYGFDSNN